MRRNNQGGFTLVESIIVVALAVAVVFAIYHFGWGSKEKAREIITENDIKTVQTALSAFALQSNGLYPTDDGTLPTKKGEYKLIVWYASFKDSGKEYAFYPDFVERLPKSWDEGIWRIDNGGKVFVSSE